MSKDTIKSLRKRNDDLKAQIECLMKDFKKLEDNVKQSEARSAEQMSPPSTVEKETIKSLEYLGNEYDDLNSFRTSARKQISQLESRTTEIATNVENLSKAIDDAQEYSYSFNVKLLGIPELKNRESAIETSTLCVQIFKDMGAQVSLQDIDIAHRVSTRRNIEDRPKPIICKFIRRLAREQVMAVRKNIKKVDPRHVGLSEESMANAAIYDHLSPKTQKLLRILDRSRYKNSVIWRNWKQTKAIRKQITEISEFFLKLNYFILYYNVNNMANSMSIEEITLNKDLLRELPYHGLNHIQFHGQFNNSLQSSLPTKKYLERLTSVHDLDLFNLNISDDNSEPVFWLPKIRCKYYSPHSFSQLKSKFCTSAIASSFSLFHNNVRSLKSNLENLQSHLLEELNYPFSIIGITETRITQETICDFNPSIPNYKFEFVPTPLAAGGVGMYINNNLNYTIIERISAGADPAKNLTVAL